MSNNISSENKMLASLPTELHLRIRSYLSPASSIALSLTGKRFYSAYAPLRTRAFSRHKFWKMISHDDPEVQKKMLDRWMLRNTVLPLLRHWIEATAANIQMDDLDGTVTDSFWDSEICVGCAKFRPYGDGWVDGWTYEDVIYHDTRFDCWIGQDLQSLAHFIFDGQLCKSCSSDWEELRVL